MGNRLSKIYTRTGDEGTTGLGDGSRVRKDDLRVEAYGEVDELNSVIGLLAAGDSPAPVPARLADVQHDLFDLGGELCIPGHKVLKSERVEALEAWLDEMNEGLEPLAEFILPGGSEAAALCHIARTVCRRAERRVSTLRLENECSVEALTYLNRLSDLLFVLARWLNKSAGVNDVLWDRAR